MVRAMSETLVGLHLAANQLDSAAQTLFESGDRRLAHAGRCLAGAAMCLREAVALQSKPVSSMPGILDLLEPEGHA
jgi:hypothetical protein